MEVLARAGGRLGGRLGGRGPGRALAGKCLNDPGHPPIFVVAEDGGPMVMQAMADSGADTGAAWLARGGLRPTRQRLLLAELLVGDGQNRHVTAESLYALAGAAGEKVSLATVYNTLRAFCEAGLMNEVVVDGARSYFDTRMDDHPHFYWEETHALTDAPTDSLTISGLPQAPEGMQVARVDVVIRLRRTHPAP